MVEWFIAPVLKTGGLYSRDVLQARVSSDRSLARMSVSLESIDMHD